jgi:hypothetical protein
LRGAARAKLPVILSEIVIMEKSPSPPDLRSAYLMDMGFVGEALKLGVQMEGDWQPMASASTERWSSVRSSRLRTSQRFFVPPVPCVEISTWATGR